MSGGGLVLRTTGHLKLYNTDRCVILNIQLLLSVFVPTSLHCYSKNVKYQLLVMLMTYCGVDVLVDQKFTFALYLEAFSWLPFQLCIIKSGFSLMELWSTTVSLKLRVISDVIGLKVHSELQI